MENQNYQEYPVIVAIQSFLNQLRNLNDEQYEEDISKLQAFLDEHQEPGMSRFSTLATPVTTARKTSRIYIDKKNTQADLLRLSLAPLGCPELKNTASQKALLQYQQSMEQLNRKMGDSVIMYNTQISELQSLNFMLNQHCAALTNDAAGLQTEIVQVYQMTQNNRKTLQQRQEFHNKTVQMQNQFRYRKQKRLDECHVQLLQLSDGFQVEIDGFKAQKHAVLDEIAEIERKTQEEQIKLQAQVEANKQLFASLRREMLSELERKLNAINSLQSRGNECQAQIAKLAQKKLQFKIQMEQLSGTFADVESESARSLAAVYEERLAAFRAELDEKTKQRLSELARTMDRQWEAIKQLQRENEDLRDEIGEKQRIDARLKAQITFYEQEFLKYQEIRNKYQKEEKDILIGILEVKKQLKNQTDEKSGIVNKKLHFEVKNRSQNEQIKQLNVLIQAKQETIENLQREKLTLCQEKVNQQVLATNAALLAKRDGILQTLKDAGIDTGKTNGLESPRRGAETQNTGVVSPPVYQSATQTQLDEILDAPGLLFRVASPSGLQKLQGKKSFQSTAQNLTQLRTQSPTKETKGLKKQKSKKENENISPYMQFSTQKRRINTR